MKNTSGSGGNIFRKKGFFIALYSCLGVVAALAIVVTVANRPPAEQGTEFAYEQEETTPVGADQVDSYLAGFDEEAWFRPRQPQPEPQPPPRQPSQPPSPQRPPSPPPTPPTQPPPQPPPGTPPTGEPVEPHVEQKPAEPPGTEPAPAPEPSPTSEYEPTPAPQSQAAHFTPFSDGDRMAWPVYGETVMPFSANALIYDPTLDQFRTNDNLRIAASEGDPVRAGAYGRVIATGRNVRQGNYVIIDHGNGWVATYGQLMDSVPVSEGDIVSSGQIIGGVGQPSIFGSANGTHVHLRIERDEVAINPYYVLTARGDC